ncbi:hypothetical protein EDC01DRAFT_658418, partial [Geopyxis carbonaria]
MDTLTLMFTIFGLFFTAFGAIQGLKFLVDLLKGKSSKTTCDLLPRYEPSMRVPTIINQIYIAPDYRCEEAIRV